MSRVHLAVVCVLSLVFSVVVLAAAPASDAQPASACPTTVMDEADYRICLESYNTGSVDVTINLGADITATTADPNGGSAFPIVANTTPATPTLTIEGNGFTLNPDSAGIGIVSDGIWLANGDLVIRDLTITGSSGSGYAGLFAVGASTALVERSTFTDNDEGVRVFDADVTIVDSTITGSTAVDSFGGTGVIVDGVAAVAVKRSTIVGNEGFGLELAFGSLEVSGSLVAGNGSGQCNVAAAGAIDVGDGGNVFEDNTCDGVATAGVAGTYGELAANDCAAGAACTETIALNVGSPAINANTTCDAGSTDQRGFGRPAEFCDAGAFEIACAASFTVDSAAQLNEALACYNEAPAAAALTTIEFDGDITAIFDPTHINNPATPPPSLLIDGRGFSLNGSNLAGKLLWQQLGNTTITNITVADALGEGVQNTSGDMAISNSTFDGNSVGVLAINTSLDPAAVEPQTTIVNSTFANNGWGVTTTLAEMRVESSTFTNNSSGAIDQPIATPTIVGSLVDGLCKGITGIVDGGGNVFTDSSCGTVTADVAGTLGALAQNACAVGVPCTQTVALLPGSPAIDANAGCVAGDLTGLADQRGVARVAGTCDAGAFELGDLDVDGDGSEGPLGDSADCDDDNAAINPGATDVPYNSIDEDCDGADLADVDGDGSSSTAATGGLPDCDDTNAAINPAADEVAYDGVDNDCVGGDLIDADGDGSPALSATGGAPDCDDTDAAINPGATDLPDNGVDENCDGRDEITVEPGRCNNLVVTIDMNTNGGNGTGGPGNDVILGTPNNDVIDSGGGNDTICSGDGADRINSGAGDDWVLSGNGDDTVILGDGDDWVRGGAGDDILNGGAGIDRLFGVAGDDTITGGDGDDTIHGNRGNDTLYGDGGDDRIFGYADDDTIYGGDGDDRLQGNFGEDLIFGEAGNDIIQGRGDDDILHGGEGDDRMHGNLGDDEMYGDAGDDTMYGYGDDDVVNGGLGDDIINGNRGNDTLNGNQDNDQIRGADGNDTVNGGSGNDILFGNALDDAINGGSGDDTIDGGEGTDTCFGGTDTDTTTRCEPNNQ